MTCDILSHMKTCCRCGESKAKSEFGKSSSRRDGLNVYCLPCARAVGRESAAKHPEKARERGRLWYLANKERRLQKSRAWEEKNLDRRREISRKWREANPEKQREASRAWYANNREAALAADKRAREANLEKFLERERLSYARHAEKRRTKSERWRAANPSRVTYHTSTRRSALAKRTPPWLTHEHYEQMRAMFWAASLMEMATGEKHHVDHIVPLRGKLVSGLNVPWNMQVLSATENLKKSNRHDL